MGGGYGSGGRDLIPRKLSMSKMKKRDEARENRAQVRLQSQARLAFKN